MPIKISHSYFICYLKLIVLTEIVGPTPSTLLPCNITKVVCFNPDFLWDTCGTSEDYEGKRYTTVLKEEHNFHYHILHLLSMIRILLEVLFVRITVMNIYIYIYIYLLLVDFMTIKTLTCWSWWGWKSSGLSCTSGSWWKRRTHASQINEP